MHKRWQMLIIGVGFFLSFIVFSYLVHKNLFTQFDFDTTVRLQDNLSRRLDDIFSLFSDIGKFEVLSVILLMVIVWNRRVLAGAISICLYVLFHIIEIYGKFFVDHLPPPEFMLRTKRIVDFPQFHVRTEFSYPSGHSGRTIFLSLLLIMLIWQSKRMSRIVKISLMSIVCVFDVVMLISRAYLGEHWASDVIGGAMLGAGFACISSSFYSNTTKA